MPKRNSEDNYVCLDNIHKNGNKYIWSESIGKNVLFKYNGVVGYLKIIDYVIKNINNRKKYFLNIEYQGNMLGQIQTDSFINGKIGKLIKPFINDWDYEIGQTLCSQKRNITIINRKLDEKTGVQLYQIKCNSCGFDGFSFYSGRIGDYQDEYWTDNFRLNSGYGCPCCSGDIVVEGINDINTTASWMSGFFVNKEDCKTHTYNSNRKAKMKCPYCNEKKEYKIASLYHYKYLPCACRDNMSIPNKISYYTFRSLSKILDYYENEYCPTWAKPYKYDNYIEFNQQKFIVEMDGRLGHGNIDFSTGKEDKEGQKRDLIKNEFAESHNIKVFRINCVKNQNDYHSMFNDLLCVIRKMIPYDISNYINEEDIMKKALGNTIYEVCKYYSKHNDISMAELARRYSLHPQTVTKYVKNGSKYGWCNYISLQQKRKKQKDIIIAYWKLNPNYSIYKISKDLKMDRDAVKKYITKELQENGKF